ncbi:AraC family transcriptional regulator [Pseudomonas soli]
MIRTLDPLHPMQVRYRAALRPDKAALNVAENEKKFTLTF